MIENNDVFEELMLGLCKCLVKVPCNYSCLSFNGFFWSVGPLKKNNGKLSCRGDFSSATSDIGYKRQIECIQNHIPSEVEDVPVKDHDYVLAIKNITESSKSWALSIKECIVRDKRLLIFLNREIAFTVILNTVLSEELEYGTSLCQNQVVSVTSDNVPDTMDLSQLRLILTKEILVNVLARQGYSVLSENDRKEDCIRLHVTLNPTLKMSDSHTIVCGVVRNSITNKKESEIHPEDYQRLRERDMEEASIHKYGSSVLEASWKGFISSLASSAMKLDLLHSRISHPISLDMADDVVLNREKSYKGPQFLLYNYARLISILKRFDEKVKEGVYPPLVSIDAADFTLLSQEEEWELLFSFILPYPSLMMHVVNIKSLKFETHILIKFLQRLCTCVSAYYSRFRILSEPRTHLLPLMYARIHLISAVKQIMLNIFQLFNIVPVSQM